MLRATHSSAYNRILDGREKLWWRRRPAGGFSAFGALKTRRRDAGATRPASFIHARGTNQNCRETLRTRPAMNPNPLSYLHEQLADLEAKGLHFRLRVLEGEQKPIAHFDGKEVINLSPNNYPGLH